MRSAALLPPQSAAGAFSAVLCLALLCLTLLSLVPTTTRSGERLPAVPLAAAWGCKGHMLVAQIAYNHLTELNRDKADRLARHFHESGPFPLSPNFVELACWSDDLKAWHQFSMGAWHFMDIPFRADEDDNVSSAGRAAAAAPLETVAGPHVVSASRDMLTALQYGHKSPYYHLEFSLFNLVHFIGDMHQPLHTATRVTRKLPHGDRGGNMFHVRVNGHTESLHSLWDNMCEVTNKEAAGGARGRGGRQDRPRRAVEPLRLRRPLSAADYATHIVARAEALEDAHKFPKALVQVKKEDLRRVAEESHGYAVNTSYQDIAATEEVVGTAYLRRCQELCEQRIVLGGLRLAYLLNEALEDVDNVPEFSPSTANGTTEEAEGTMAGGRRRRSHKERRPRQHKKQQHHRHHQPKGKQPHGPLDADRADVRSSVLTAVFVVYVMLLLSSSQCFAKPTDHARFQWLLSAIFLAVVLLVYCLYGYEKQ